MSSPRDSTLPDSADTPRTQAETLAALRAQLAPAAARPDGPAPLAPLAPMRLARGRLHQATGPARRVLAAMIAGAAQPEGPVLWLHPAWQRAQLYPLGLKRFADPGALIQVACPRAADVPWAAEEALRSGAVALVVAELPVLPDLRQVRRLHLAAAEGVARAAAAGHIRRAPLALALAHEAPEATLAGVETRWRLATLPPNHHDSGRHDQNPPIWRGEALPAWRLDLLRARDTPPGTWRLDWTPQGLHSEPLARKTQTAPHGETHGDMGRETGGALFAPEISRGGAGVRNPRRRP